MKEEISRTYHALKWSSITELAAKLLLPLTNMILARILAPEAFGILATVTMVISFAEVFVESGFQKFLIQHAFADERQEAEYMSVAFWANLFFSLGIWLVLTIACEPIAALVGNEGMGILLAVTGVTIPLFGIIGIQDCKLKKHLEFKGLFYVRIFSALVPLAVTLPLALLGWDYWALIVGNIAGVVLRSLLLLFVGKFRPLLYFRFRELRYMLGFGIWTLLDGVALWLASWIDSFLIARAMSDYYLGLYKNATSMVTSLFAIVTAALAPVLFSSLSRLQDRPEDFNRLFLKVQKTLAIFLLPMGVGLWLYRDLATSILFGGQWGEASAIVGVMALSTVLRTLLISLYGDVFRAKGHFYLPFILQVFEIVLLVPACVLSVRHGFWPLVYTRALLKLDLVLPEALAVWRVCQITPKTTAKILFHPVAATAGMTLLLLLCQSVGRSAAWQIVSILLGIFFYFVLFFLFREEREGLLRPVLARFSKKTRRQNNQQ